MAQLPIVYQDGMRVVAIEYPMQGYDGVLYAMSRKGQHSDGPELVLDQNEARELAAALTWIISEVDKAYGKESFKPAASLNANKG